MAFKSVFNEAYNQACVKEWRIVIDDTWDRLNRVFMFGLLVVMAIIVTVRQYTGGVISCNGFSKFSEKFAEKYCWYEGLHTIEEAYNLPAMFAPYPGIVPEEIAAQCGMIRDRAVENKTRIDCPDPSEYLKPTRVTHLWYQWVPIYFWLSAAAFILPYLLYHNVGMGEIKPLIRMLKNPAGSQQEQVEMIQKAAAWLYYKFDVYMDSHSLWKALIVKHSMGFSTVFIKGLYAGVSFGCFFLTAQMFSIGDFKTYGVEWFSKVRTGDGQALTEVKDKLFPKMVACEVKRWGPSGIEEEQGMCVLAPNVINQYLFLILWFCLVLLMATNILSILTALIKLLFTYGSYRKLLSTAFLRDDSTVRHMYFSIGSSGRLVLHVLADNIPPRQFESILITLASKLVKDKLKGNGKNVSEL